MRVNVENSLISDRLPSLVYLARQAGLFLGDGIKTALDRRAQTCQLSQASRGRVPTSPCLLQKYFLCLESWFSGFLKQGCYTLHPLRLHPGARALGRGGGSFEVARIKAEASVSLASLRLSSTFVSLEKPVCGNLSPS